MSATVRGIKQLLTALEQSEGVGARVKRTIGTRRMDILDPFLLLDEFFVRKPAGFPNHPHRGFETITYMLDGSFKHGDNKGNAGVIHEGAVQWMTAGAGVVHSEMPVGDGVNHGLQLWVNLPARDKFVPPAYQDLEADALPRVTSGGVDVKIIAGEYDGKKSTVTMHTPIVYLDIKLDAGAVFENALPEEYDGFVYTLQGRVSVGPSDKETVVEPSTLGVLDAGSSVRIAATDEAARLVLIAGVPLREPVARHGPFVMNTRAEIEQAFDDFYDGKF